MQNGLIDNCMNTHQNSCLTVQYWQGGQVTFNNGVNLFNINNYSATPTTGDLNNDGSVSLQDLSMLLSNWGTNNSSADLDKNGTVGLSDLSILLSHWGS